MNEDVGVLVLFVKKCETIKIVLRGVGCGQRLDSYSCGDRFQVAGTLFVSA